eukprot:CAMPEP_0195053534 /NCGR_PEP_ID=MMETSP0448-20130528/2615_1 /TAXON_ID=66468 /ORGANISM="Heterocapsa triquestra, Strain CCMP 448" /LENGTH=150 /DNA_ID=CAMNT_0040082829 /DNA_START=532 /DNA_END=985 /DNA_ORIENTATION=+
MLQPQVRRARARPATAGLHVAEVGDVHAAHQRVGAVPCAAGVAARRGCRGPVVAAPAAVIMGTAEGLQSGSAVMMLLNGVIAPLFRAALMSWTFIEERTGCLSRSAALTMTLRPQLYAFPAILITALASIWEGAGRRREENVNKTRILHA